MTIDHSLVDHEHYCDLPAILSSGPPTPEDQERYGQFAMSQVTIDHPAGTRFFCDGCPKVWIVVWNGGWVSGAVARAPYYSWQPETRKERRRRLRLHWWQRSEDR